MILNSLHIVQFKNYLEAKLQFIPQFNLFAGLNGSGKTNLMDAIYYLSMTKSFFHNRDQHNVLRGKDFFRLVGQYGELNIVAKVKPGAEKVFAKNGKEYDQLVSHIGTVPIMMSAPSDIRIITDSSQIRRKYMDGLISQLDRKYLHYLITYNRYLRQRNAALKQAGNPDFSLLEIYTEKMQESADYIHQRRVETVSDMTPYYQTHYQQFAGHEEHSSFAYESALSTDSFAALSKASLKKDVILKRTTEGIHRDDFKFSLNDAPARQFASQGQIKSILFSLHLAKHQLFQHKFGYAPILLLDDIFAKLDDRRVGQLLQILSSDEYGQIFISDTSADRLKKVFLKEGIQHFKTFIIDQGKIVDEFTNG